MPSIGRGRYQEERPSLNGFCELFSILSEFVFRNGEFQNSNQYRSTVQFWEGLGSSLRRASYIFFFPSLRSERRLEAFEEATDFEDSATLTEEPRFRGESLLREAVGPA